MKNHLEMQSAEFIDNRIDSAFNSLSLQRYYNELNDDDISHIVSTLSISNPIAIKHNGDRELIFDEICNMEEFIYFESIFSEDVYNDFLNDVVYFILINQYNK